MPKIVVCDDEPHIVHGLQFLFELEGYDVRVARNGIEALALIREDRPDMLIVDVMMPKMSGYEVVQRLRGAPATESLLIVMLTAKGQRTDAAIAEEVGVTEFMTKPFSPIKLRERVRTLLAEQCELVA